MSRTARIMLIGLWTAILAGLAVLAVLFAMVFSTGQQTHAVAPAHHATVLVALPAPTTAQGYAAMFAALPVAQWGGADLGITVPLGHRAVWLFGDTLSDDYAIVHSTAITQDGGRLHVSHQGQQLLPDGGTAQDGRKIIYWIEQARALGSHQIVATAEQVSIGQANSWDFHRANVQDRQALLSVSAAGDVTFTRWLGWVPDPHISTWFEGLGQSGHIGYAKHAHPELALAGGKHLVTEAQNWSTAQRTAGGSIDYAKYRLLFRSS